MTPCWCNLSLLGGSTLYGVKWLHWEEMEDKQWGESWNENSKLPIRVCESVIWLCNRLATCLERALAFCPEDSGIQFSPMCPRVELNKFIKQDELQENFICACSPELFSYCAVRNTAVKEMHLKNSKKMMLPLSKCNNLVGFGLLSNNLASLLVLTLYMMWARNTSLATSCIQWHSTTSFLCSTQPLAPLFQRANT